MLQRVEAQEGGALALAALAGAMAARATVVALGLLALHRMYLWNLVCVSWLRSIATRTALLSSLGACKPKPSSLWSQSRHCSTQLRW